MTEIEPELLTLSQLGSHTKRLFQQLIDRFDKIPENEESNLPKTKFAAEADRFSLWAVNMGLFVTGHGSLDYRVRDARNIQEMIKTFIATLNNALVEAYTYYYQEDERVDSSRTPAGSDSDGELSDNGWNDDSDDEMESDQDLLLESIRDPIDRLYKLSTLIRNPSSRLVSSKMHHHKQIDPETGIDLLESVKEFDLDYIRSAFTQYRQSKSQEEQKLLSTVHQFIADNEPTAPPVDERQQMDLSYSVLISRLALANVRRRQQLSYWKKHRQKLARHTTRVDSGDAKTQVSTAYSPAPHPNVMKIQAEISARVPSLMLPLSVTTATQLKIATQPIINDNLSTVSVSRYEPSLWKPGNDRLDFPPPPKIPSHQRFFECPYCYTLCPKAMLGEEAWRAHLIHDLRPYVCTYEDCKNSDQLYDTRQDWIHHESSTHRRVLYCSEHPDKTFYSSQDYLEHVRSRHPGYSEEISPALLINANESTLTIPDRCCPICTLSIESMEVLQKHIAVHLERFSLFSLPKDVDGGDWHGNASKYSEEANINVEGSRDHDFEGGSVIVSESEKLIDRPGTDNLKENRFLYSENMTSAEVDKLISIIKYQENSGAITALSEEDSDSDTYLSKADSNAEFRYLQDWLKRSNDYYPTTEKMQKLCKKTGLPLPTVKNWLGRALDQRLNEFPRAADCIFGWLGCKFESSNYDKWATHIHSHLPLPVPQSIARHLELKKMPTSWKCRRDSFRIRDEENPFILWNQKLQHIFLHKCSEYIFRSVVDRLWGGYYFASPYKTDIKNTTASSVPKAAEISQDNIENQNSSSYSSLQYQVQVAVSSRNYMEVLRLVHSDPNLTEIALQIASSGRKQALEEYLYQLQKSDLISRTFLPQISPGIVLILKDLDKDSPFGNHETFEKQYENLTTIIKTELHRLQELPREEEEKMENDKISYEESLGQVSDVKKYNGDLRKSKKTSYSCPNCDSEIYSKTNLKKHMRDRECISGSTPIHAFSTENLWRCPHLTCSHIYASRRNLGRHYSSVHGKKLEDFENKDDDKMEPTETHTSEDSNDINSILADKFNVLAKWKTNSYSPKISRLAGMLARLEKHINEFQGPGSYANENLLRDGGIYTSVPLVQEFLQNLKTDFFYLQRRAEEIKVVEFARLIDSEIDAVLRKLLVGNFALALWQGYITFDPSIPPTICVSCSKAALIPGYRLQDYQIRNTICSPCTLLLKELKIFSTPRGISPTLGANAKEDLGIKSSSDDSSKNYEFKPHRNTLLSEAARNIMTSSETSQTPNHALKAPLESDLDKSLNPIEMLQRELDALKFDIAQIEEAIRNFKVERNLLFHIRDYVELIEGLVSDLERICQRLQVRYWDMLEEGVWHINSESIDLSLWSIPNDIEYIFQSINQLVETNAEGWYTTRGEVQVAKLLECGYCSETGRKPAWVPDSDPGTAVCTNCRMSLERRSDKFSLLSINQFIRLASIGMQQASKCNCRVTGGCSCGNYCTCGHFS